MPFFVGELIAYKIEPDLAERRFGVAAYQDESIVKQLEQLSRWHERSAVIQKALFRCEDVNEIEIEIHELYELLISGREKDRARDLFRNVRALGTAMGRMKRDKLYGDYYSSRESGGRTYWIIKRKLRVCVGDVAESASANAS